MVHLGQKVLQITWKVHDMKKKEAEFLENILAVGGEIVGWQEVTDSKGDIRIIPRVRIDKSTLLKFEKERK